MTATFSLSVVEDGESLFAGRTEDWNELLWCAAEAQRRRPRVAASLLKREARATVYLRDAFGRLHRYNADGTTTDLSAPRKRRHPR
jgi:hypothetical protein